MLGTVPSLLLGTTAATAAFHTLISDHWLTFVLVERARRLPVPPVARHRETASGVLIAIVGAVVLLMER